MYKETWDVISRTALTKFDFLKKNPLGFFIASMLAGIFIGFGVILSFTIGGLFPSGLEQKIVMGASFAIALSLIVFCGSELFTGNNLVIGSVLVDKKVSFMKAVKLLLICLLGNFVGSIFIAVIFHFSGLHTQVAADLFAKITLAKMSGSFVSLFIKAMLCNTLVCLAVWCTFRCKNEVAKLIIIWWCLFAFVTSGFEHSIANMSIMAIGLMNPAGLALSISGYFWNLLVVLFGNVVGAFLFVVFPYSIISKQK